MPPKRKRAEDITPVSTEPSTSARASRSTAKTTGDSITLPSKISKTSATKKAAAKPTASKSGKSKGSAVEVTSNAGEDDEATPLVKKKKAAAPKAIEKKKTTNTKKAKATDVDAEHSEEAPPKAATKQISSPAPPPPKFQPYSATRVRTLFETYRDPDEPSIIGPEGFQQLCIDAEIPLEGVLPLVLAWQLDAKEMARFTENEWVEGLKALQISSLPQLSHALHDLEDLLIINKQPLTLSKAKHVGEGPQPYNRERYWGYAADKKAAMLRLYQFCFALAKSERMRNIDMETATAFWSVLLVPQYPIMTEVIEFINEKGSFKGANKDLWGMMLEFCQSVKPSLENYEADGAWPTLLDDFVVWKKSKTGDVNGNGQASGQE